MEPPASVRAIGSLNAMLGVAGLVSTAVAAAACLAAGWRQEWHVLGMTDAARFWAVTAGIVLLGFGHAVVQLTAGIGLLRSLGWGITAARGYAWYSLLFAAAYAFLHFTLFYATLVDWLTVGPAALSRSVALSIMVAVGIAMPLLMVIYPLVTLFALRGGDLRAALEAARSAPRADDRISLIPQFTLRRLLIVMGASSIFFLVLGNAFAGRTWAIAMSLGAASLVATFGLYGAAFFLVWILSLIWRPRSARTSSLPPAVPQSPFQPV